MKFKQVIDYKNGKAWIKIKHTDFFVKIEPNQIENIDFKGKIDKKEVIFTIDKIPIKKVYFCNMSTDFNKYLNYEIKELDIYHLTSENL